MLLSAVEHPFVALINETYLQTQKSLVSSAVVLSAESATADVVVRARANPGSVSPAELRVAIIGNVDSGKSTMVSTMQLCLLLSSFFSCP